MIYGVTKVTAANTAQNNPDKTIIRVTNGFVYRVYLFFPFGPAGLLHAQIFDGSYQVWPSTIGDSFHVEGSVIDFEDCYFKMTPPYEFKLVTWNLDDTLEHEVQVKIGMVSQDIYIARFLPSYAYNQLSEILSKQEQEKREIDEQAKSEILEKPINWKLSKKG